MQHHLDKRSTTAADWLARRWVATVNSESEDTRIASEDGCLVLCSFDVLLYLALFVCLYNLVRLI